MTPAVSTALPIRYHRTLPRERIPARDDFQEVDDCVLLHETVKGTIRRHPEHGPVFLVTTPIDRLAGAEDVSKQFAEQLNKPDSGLRQRLGARYELHEVSVRDIVFLDIETAGLSSSPLFLIGTMYWHNHCLEVWQFFARTYAEEAAAISLSLEICRNRKLLVTFNGKSFDAPYVKMRAAANGIDSQMPAGHFDLLHESRRAWRKSLPDCRLQTLERYVCKRIRSFDIPGSEIPDAYHAFVRTGNARHMAGVLNHNLLDLIALAEIMTKLP
jgi:uncharacterized protein YprB with RNaseH-like and TPR domain